MAVEPGREIVEEDVQFFSDGLRIGAVLFSSAQTAAAPAIAMSHGWSGAVNERGYPLARRLAEAGYAVLCLDHRGFGRSQGPRAECDPEAQVRDLRDALTYLQSRPDVDASRLGLLGASFGGAIVSRAAALDVRASATLSIVGVGDAGRWMAGLRPYRHWYEFRQRVEANHRRRVLDGTGEMTTMRELMPGPDTEAMDAEYELMNARYPEGYPLENAWHALTFRPERSVVDIAPRAICFLTCADDTVVPASESLALHAAAGEPKQLVVFPSGNHGGPLGPLVEKTAEVAREFFGQHLGWLPGAAPAAFPAAAPAAV